MIRNIDKLLERLECLASVRGRERRQLLNHRAEPGSGDIDGQAREREGVGKRSESICRKRRCALF
jgi:hypothetical protein